MVNQRFVELFYPNDDPVGRVIRLIDTNGRSDSSPLADDCGRRTHDSSAHRGRNSTGRLPPALLVRDEQRSSWVTSPIRPGIVLSCFAKGSPPLVPRNPLQRSALERVAGRLAVSPIGTVIAVIASIALLLSVVGLYAFTAYAVQQRTHEIGVRMALGAQPSQVVRLFVTRGLLPLGIGLLIGLVGAFAVGRLLQGLLIHTSPTDPVTLVFITLLVVVVSLAACILPARKAANLDPLTVLRYD